jgi:hypothetical protein
MRLFSAPDCWRRRLGRRVSFAVLAVRPCLVALILLFGAIHTVPSIAQVPAFVGQWNAPRAVGIAFDPSGNVYVAEYSNYPTHIDVHAPDGALTWNGRVQIFGSLPTPTNPKSWGQLKAFYR